MKVADKIAEWLHEKGVKTCFGIVGGGNVALWDAITRGKKTQIVCCHHEQAAAMAAAYYARVTGGIGFALVTTGGGSTNAITGVMAAYMDRVPLLVISGNEAIKYFDVDAPLPRVFGVQGFESALLADGATKYATQVFMEDDLMCLLEGAFNAALEAPAGPVWIDIPKDIQDHAFRP